MARQQTGNKGQPIYLSTGAPSDAADLTEVGQYAADVGNTRVGTTNDRISFGNVGAVTEGLAWRDTTAKRTYYWEGGAWVLETWGAAVSSSFSGSSTYRGAHGLGKLPAWAQIQDIFYTGATGKRNYFIQELTATEYVIRGVQSSDGSLLGSVSFQVYVTVGA